MVTLPARRVGVSPNAKFAVIFCAMRFEKFSQFSLRTQNTQGRNRVGVAPLE